MLTKNYIITVHKNPRQLKRLIDRLNDDNSLFFIHVDLKTDIRTFEHLQQKSNVIFIDKRIDCVWGDFSQVRATLNLIDKVLQYNKHGYIIFISGQDYPIKSNSEINNYLKQNSNYDFIDYELDPIDKNSNTYETRIKKYKINLSSSRGDHILLHSIFSLTKSDLKTILKVLIKRRINPLIFRPIFTLKRKSMFKYHYKGTNWWCLKTSTVEKAYKYYLSNQKYLNNYYKYTLCADEQFFQTILKELSTIDTTINILPNLHFIDWSRKNEPRPATFKITDSELLFNQPKNKLFARKFDSDVDEEILNLLDQKLSSSHL